MEIVDNIIPIAFQTDNNFASPALVAMYSLMKNASRDYYYYLYCVCSDQLSTDMRKRLEVLETRFDNCKVTFLDLDDQIFSGAYYKEGITYTGMFRLLLGSLLNEYDKCIYIDVDTIVAGDISELWKEDIEEYIIGAVPDCGMQLFPEQSKEYLINNNLGFEAIDEYFNSGVMLLNLELIRSGKWEEKFLSFKNEKFLYGDQDILNKCCHGYIKYLPLKYNFFRRFWGREELLDNSVWYSDELRDINDNVIIIHYAESQKPWENARGIASDIWWQYASEILEDEVHNKMHAVASENELHSDYRDIYNKMPLNRKIVIWSYTNYSRQICDFLINAGYENILFFIDNNPDKLNERYRGINVVPEEYIRKIPDELYYFVNAGRRAKDEIDNIIHGLGYKDIFYYDMSTFTKPGIYYSMLSPSLYMDELETIIKFEKGISLADWNGVVESSWYGKYCLDRWLLSDKGKEVIFNLVKELPVQKNKIVFMTSGRYTCHGKAIAEKLLEINNCNSLDIVWLVFEDLTIVPNGIRKVRIGDVLNTSKELATAHIWISNVELPKYVTKKVEQIYIQTKHWTSITLKKFYFDAPSLLKDRTAVRHWKKNFADLDYMITGSDFDTNSCRRGFDFHGEVWQIGSSRIDILFQDNKELNQNIRSYFNLNSDDHILIYAPTYRFKNGKKVEGMEKGNIVIDFERLLKALEKRFSGVWKVLVRLHPAVAKESDVISYSDKVINASYYDDIESLIAVSDILITDYSSIMFDPAFVLKTVFLFAPDYEDYINNEYELLLDMTELPFDVATSNEELEQYIDKFDDNIYSDRIHKFMNKHNVIEDGHASERAVAKIMNLLA